MTKSLLLFPDQLTISLIPPGIEEIILAEIFEDWEGHHKQKIVFFLSAMRHFAEELCNLGYKVIYYDLEEGYKSWTSFLQFLDRKPLVVIKPSDKRWRKLLINLEVDILEDKRFFCQEEEFQIWLGDKKEARLEFFYRYLRKKHKILLDKEGQPEGGNWNYDKENRKPFNKNLKIPSRAAKTLSSITKNLLSLVETFFPNNFGNLIKFNLETTRKGALEELNYFLNNYLVYFGDYQDVMMTGEPYLFHSNLSSYLNIGLLSGPEVVKRAEEKYRLGLAPLASVEGFIRQILGWREFIRGLYYSQSYEGNFFSAQRKLPLFYWTAKTKVFCIKEVVKLTQDYSYSHHIQRLMITGNFALLTGLKPSEVSDWYFKVYSDALEWVELPNTFSMALFADGGFLASKPYAASANYIKKMSNFCQECFYNPNELLGPKACPFNSLYWYFFIRNKELLQNNHRLRSVFYTLGNFSKDKIHSIEEQAKSYLIELDLDRL